MFLGMSCCAKKPEVHETMLHEQDIAESLAQAVEDAVQITTKTVEEVSAEQEASLPAPTPQAAPEPEAEAPSQTTQAVPVGETRICPVSGMSTLQGLCPFAKPKKKAKSGGKPPKLQLRLSLLHLKGDERVSVDCYPAHSDHWAALELPNTAKKDEIKTAYRSLCLKWHPDKNQDNIEEATERFQKIKDAFQVLKDLDGELAFPWDNYPEKQEIMTGREAASKYGKLGTEACMEDPMKGQAFQHMIRSATVAKVLHFEKETVEGDRCVMEIWCDAFCLDEKSDADHIVKIYRRNIITDEEQDTLIAGCIE
eukprot:TRINITY_DN20826_c0_g1_i1.p1 TRINITY_DN20826_c0_g1~~TRINITY_DN20826_c0_g1_i1.p1  ORF type:complete len:329 (+),score=66.56 TRINITY_DN20826_c0_g1_i1:59-988(+)